MSLRIFHIIFIIAAFGLSLFVALWGFREYAATHSSGKRRNAGGGKEKAVRVSFLCE